MSVQLSPALADLFPPGAVATVLLEPGDLAALLPAEAACLKRAVTKRLREFAAGRQCAHRALEELGIRDFPLLMAVDRQPLWPDGVVGSITHTSGYCAAVVAERTRLCALGLDAELAGAVREELWPIICGESELVELARLAPSEQARTATLLFSAKEAFHKCQFPLTGEWLGFEDVSVALETLGTSHGEFTVSPQRSLALASHVPPPWRGRFLVGERVVSTGIGLAASSSGWRGAASARDAQ